MSNSSAQTATTQTGRTSDRGRAIPAFFAPLATRRAWSELAYALAALPVGIAGFVFTVTTVSLSAGLAVTFIGLPLLAATGVASRQLGEWWRRTANAMVGWEIRQPPRFAAGAGRFGWIGASLKDAVAWRARAYAVLALPLGILSFVVATVFYSVSLGAITYWIWGRYLPCDPDTVGACQSGPYLWIGHRVESPLDMTLFAIEGGIVLLLAPWVVRGVLTLDKWCATALLGPSRRLADSERISELEHTRAQAVDDSAATLRRIERDLHDGTQARLVALAMNVGLAKEKLAEGGPSEEALTLLERAHATAKDAITEVRGLARGIHPAVLDTGLDAALATLASRSPIPVVVQASMDHRPGPSIETIAYFCAAELVTNAVKHSGAQGIRIDVTTSAEALTLSVQDDGHGGAAISHAAAPGGTGVAGLQQRVHSVDGVMTVHSPSGGPTVITVRLPLTVP
jgi:signal transduction histidine kinase